MAQNDAETIISKLRATYSTGKTRSLQFRVQQLKQLKIMFEQNLPTIYEALKKDLCKNEHVSSIYEVEYCINNIRYLLENIQEWAKPKPAGKGKWYYFDPHGVVLVIGPWNFPVQLTLLPLAGAIAGGNCVVIKPSEISSSCASVIAQLIPKYIDTDCFTVFLGGVKETTQLLEHRFDYIFFTGSPSVGKVIHKAAARFLTPVTLELGGKSPVYLDESAHISLAAKRIWWGKIMNAGQICIAPDYLLCTSEVEHKFIKESHKILKDWFGQYPEMAPFYERIISDSNYARLERLLTKGEIVIGGGMNKKTRFIEPTALSGVNSKDDVMKEEIFGPILPIFRVNCLENAIDFINSREKPLALYVFSKRKENVNLILDSTSSGGVTINDTFLHVSLEDLPFGGVGHSGMGKYHGKATFDTFTREKIVVDDDVPFRPCNAENKIFLKISLYLTFVGAGVISGIIVKCFCSSTF